MKNYLIVGHSSGIGRALSEKLSVDNKVYGTYYRNKPAGETANSSSHSLNVLDDKPDFAFLPDTLDGLAYCPGAIQVKPFSRVSDEDLINDYKIQLIGAVKTIRACLPRLQKSKDASIVLFSTVAVGTGFSYHSIVSSSKGAIEGLIRALAAEFAPRIRVNGVAPSLTDTPLASSFLNTPEKTDAAANRHPLKRIGQAEDLANVAAFLLSEQSSWMTGQIAHVDGGLSVLK